MDSDPPNASEALDGSNSIKTLDLRARNVQHTTRQFRRTNRANPHCTRKRTGDQTVKKERESGPDMNQTGSYEPVRFTWYIKGMRPVQIHSSTPFSFFLLRSLSSSHRSLQSKPNQTLKHSEIHTGFSFKLRIYKQTVDRRILDFGLYGSESIHRFQTFFLGRGSGNL
jgi:hypothetical protein